MVVATEQAQRQYTFPAATSNYAGSDALSTTFNYIFDCPANGKLKWGVFTYTSADANGGRKLVIQVRGKPSNPALNHKIETSEVLWQVVLDPTSAPQTEELYTLMEDIAYSDDGVQGFIPFPTVRVPDDGFIYFFDSANVVNTDQVAATLSFVDL